MGVLKSYYILTKPGIIYGNMLTAMGGFLFACHWHIDFVLALSILVGTSLVIASACVFNNYIDRGIDKKMDRTKKRALVEGTISGQSALAYASVLGIVGFVILIIGTNWLTVAVGAVAFIDYVILYGLSKRHSVYGTIVGSVSGAAPVVAGYTAVTDRFDGAAIMLFLILVLWQMPHFYAIAMYRLKDYAAAGIPVLPIKKGMRSTKIEILVYVALFTIVAGIVPTISGYTGIIYLVIITGLGLAWFAMGVQGLKIHDDVKWARKMFFFSLIIIMVLAAMLALGPILV